MKHKSVLVTGGTGFVGRYLIAELLSERIQVYALTREMPLDLQGVRALKGDITDPIPLPEDVSAIYHCAGIISDESRMHAVNVIGTQRIVEAALAQKCPLVHLSSAGVIGPTRSLCVNELTECRPVTVYEKTKLEAEKVVLEGVAAGLQATMLRPTTVFGVGRVPERDSFLQLLRSIKNGKYRNIDNGQGLYGIVHAREVARAMVALSRSGQSRGEAFFINTPVSFHDFSAIAAESTGSAAPGNIPYLIAYGAAVLFSLAGAALNRKMPLTLSRFEALTNKTIYSQQRLLTETDYCPAQPIERYISEVCAEFMQKGLL